MGQPFEKQIMERTTNYFDQKKSGIQDLYVDPPPTQSFQLFEVDRSKGSSVMIGDPNLLGYSDKITAACQAANAESTKLPTISEEEKRERRLHSNRLSAQRSRERNKIEVDHWKEQFRYLTGFVKQQREENATLRRLIEKRKRLDIQEGNPSKLRLVDVSGLLQQPSGDSPIDNVMPIGWSLDNPDLTRAQHQNRQLESAGSLFAQHPRSAFATAISPPPCETNQSEQVLPNLLINRLMGTLNHDGVQRLLDLNTTEYPSLPFTAAESHASHRITSGRIQATSLSDDDSG